MDILNHVVLASSHYCMLNNGMRPAPFLQARRLAYRLRTQRAVYPGHVHSACNEQHVTKEKFLLS